MTERLNLAVEDGTKARLLALADGRERKLGSTVSELAKQAEALQALKTSYLLTLVDVLTRLDALEAAVFGARDTDED